MNYKSVNNILDDSFCTHGALIFFGRVAAINETRNMKS
jgi:hypothetical protein